MRSGVDLPNQLRPAIENRQHFVGFRRWQRHDGADNAGIREQRGRLVAAAKERRVRVETVSSEASTDVARYAALLASGTYAAIYLGVGLGRGYLGAGLGGS